MFDILFFLEGKRQHISEKEGAKKKGEQWFLMGRDETF